eukprot:scaffold18913_cov111-Isochrysis_galbana.AAC.2
MLPAAHRSARCSRGVALTCQRAHMHLQRWTPSARCPRRPRQTRNESRARPWRVQAKFEFCFLLSVYTVCCKAQFTPTAGLEDRPGSNASGSGGERSQYGTKK